MSEENVSVETRIKPEDIVNCKTIEEMIAMPDAYQLQFFKDKQATDADFEIVAPLQLPSSEK